MIVHKVHQENPHKRVIQQAVSVLEQGGILIFPTDTSYGLGCDIHNKRAIQRIYQIKRMEKNKPLSFICSDFKELSQYAIVNNQAYRMMKRLFPGPYTFILQSTNLVPRIVTTKQRTVGIRIPDNNVCLELVRGLRHPIITTSVELAEGQTMTEPEEMVKRLGHQVEMMLDAGPAVVEVSTVIDFSTDVPRVVRKGKGDLTGFEGSFVGAP
jgi:tRNA threonylcarbamoyl adenosine modification protein (Sua5/YciO/YrdC/YwlC family)